MAAPLVVPKESGKTFLALRSSCKTFGDSLRVMSRYGHPCPDDPYEKKMFFNAVGLNSPAVVLSRGQLVSKDSLIAVMRPTKNIRPISLQDLEDTNQQVLITDPVNSTNYGLKIYKVQGEEDNADLFICCISSEGNQGIILLPSAALRLQFPAGALREAHSKTMKLQCDSLLQDTFVSRFADNINQQEIFYRCRTTLTDMKRNLVAIECVLVPAENLSGDWALEMPGCVLLESLAFPMVSVENPTQNVIKGDISAITADKVLSEFGKVLSESVIGVNTILAILRDTISDGSFTSPSLKTALDIEIPYDISEMLNSPSFYKDQLDQLTTLLTQKEVITDLSKDASILLDHQDHSVIPVANRDQLIKFIDGVAVLNNFLTQAVERLPSALLNFTVTEVSDDRIFDGIRFTDVNLMASQWKCTTRLLVDSLSMYLTVKTYNDRPMSKGLSQRIPEALGETMLSAVVLFYAAVNENVLSANDLDHLYSGFFDVKLDSQTGYITDPILFNHRLSGRSIEQELIFRDPDYEGGVSIIIPQMEPDTLWSEGTYVKTKDGLVVKPVMATAIFDDPTKPCKRVQLEFEVFSQIFQGKPKEVILVKSIK